MRPHRRLGRRKGEDWCPEPPLPPPCACRDADQAIGSTSFRARRPFLRHRQPPPAAARHGTPPPHPLRPDLGGAGGRRHAASHASADLGREEVGGRRLSATTAANLRLRRSRASLATSRRPRHTCGHCPTPPSAIWEGARKGSAGARGRPPHRRPDASHCQTGRGGELGEGRGEVRERAERCGRSAGFRKKSRVYSLYLYSLCT